MRWNNKKRKIFIFIVSLLFILQIFSVLGAAGRLDDLLGDLEDLKSTESEEVKPNVDENNYTNYQEDKAGGGEFPYPSSSSSTRPSSSGSTSNTSSSSSSESASTDTVIEKPEPSYTGTNYDKYVAYSTGLTSASGSEKKMDIKYSYYETNELEVKVTYGEEPVPDAIVEVIGQKFTTGENGIIITQLPFKISDIGKILIQASTPDGHSLSTYFPQDERKQVIADGLLEFIQKTIESETIRKAFLAIIN